MSGVEALAISAAIGGLTNLVTNFIDPLLHRTRRAAQCAEECRKLACSVESIKGDVEHVRGQIEELQRYDVNATHDLQVVQNSVKNLTDELHRADLDVHQCLSASKIVTFRLSGLSKKITERNQEIKRLGSELAHTNVALALMLKDARPRRSSFDGHHHHHQLPQHPPVDHIIHQHQLPQHPPVGHIHQHQLPQHPPVGHILPHQSPVHEDWSWEHHPVMPHHPPTEQSAWQRRYSWPQLPSSDLQQGDERSHRLESGNSLHSSFGSSSHAEYRSQHLSVNQYFNHTDHNAQQGDEHSASLHRWESGNSLHSSYGSSSHGSPLHPDYPSQQSSVNQYSNHIMHPSQGIQRSNTIASTHQHEVPHLHHRSSTFPMTLDHVTHASEGVQGPLPDPFVPHLYM